MNNAYASASARSWADAERLHGAGRLGTPDHLYGLAAECALKAILHGFGAIPPAPSPPQNPFRVHINKLWNEYSAYMSGKGHATLLLPSSFPFASWRVDDRYEHDSVFAQPRVDGHRVGAKLTAALLQSATELGIVK